MMNLKDTISFKALREKGPAAIELKDDEVVQIISKYADIKVVVTQEFFLKLLTAYNESLVRAGKKAHNAVNLEDRLSSLEKKVTKVLNIATQDEEDKATWQNGRKKASNY